ncbi:unnamed protein product [Meloidogyne enterolobii]|uniref:Uncharacterized protein n=1 Tax=Meloidogyne enterolobii TaxID=390850 RepID=A0ACB1A8B5_MELEN
MKKVFLEENEMNKITTNSMSDQTRTITSRTPKDFFFINVLGEGSFSTVYYSKEVDTGDEYAIKVLLKSEIRREGRARYVLREKDIMALLTYFYGGHPFIIRLYCTFQDNDRLYFALAYAKHGELLDWLRRLGSFDEEATLFYASEILCALEFLHKCKIIHRDLKPENILVGKDWHIMLSDFGTSKIINSEQTNKEQLPQQILDDVTTTLPPPPTSSPNKNSGGVRSSFVGTAHYISPEVLKSEDVGSECDYWALGAIIFQMISGQPPFRAVNEYKILKKILGLDFHFPEGFPSIAKQLVSGLLVYKPSERLGSAANGGIEALKRHEFFKNVNWENIFTRKPPELKPYLPASCGEPAFYSDYNPLSGNIEPGLNEAALYRLMGLGPSVGGGGGGCTSLRGFMDFDCIEDFLPSTCSIPPSASASSSCSSFSSTPTTSSFQTSTDLNDTTNLLLFSNLTEEERERRRKCQLERQKQEHKYHQFVQNNLILKCGLIDKKKGLFARRRMFLLTEGPHLFYVDPVSMHLKGEVPFSAQMRTEAKNFRTFFVHTPKRTYYLFDPERHAKDWCDAIDWAREQHFSSLNKSKDKVSTKTIGQTCDNQGGGNIQNISSVTKLFSGRTKSPSSGVE